MCDKSKDEGEDINIQIENVDICKTYIIKLSAKRVYLCIPIGPIGRFFDGLTKSTNFNT